MLALLHDAVIAGVGFVVGAFTPAVGRKIKAFFVKETSAVKPTIVAGINKVETDLKAEIKKV
jgi:hypothetical protein